MASWWNRQSHDRDQGTPHGLLSNHFRNPQHSYFYKRRHNPRKRQLALVVGVIIVFLLLVPTGFLPGLPPPGPPTDRFESVLQESNKSIRSGIDSAQVFDLYIQIPPQGVLYCPWYWDGDWCVTSTISAVGGFAFTSCNSPGTCSAIVAIFLHSSWSRFVNGTNESPAWCSGLSGGTCTPTSSLQFPPHFNSIPVNQDDVIAIWSPVNGTSGLFSVDFGLVYHSCYVR